jgi:hypothetical protein
MAVTFDNDNDVIIYALENIIGHARRTQQIFVAQCIWWLASIIGLEQRLIDLIDKLQPGSSNMVSPEGNSSVEEPAPPIHIDLQDLSVRGKNQSLLISDPLLHQVHPLRVSQI